MPCLGSRFGNCIHWQKPRTSVHFCCDQLPKANGKAILMGKIMLILPMFLTLLYIDFCRWIWLCLVTTPRRGGHILYKIFVNWAEKRIAFLKCPNFISMLLNWILRLKSGCIFWYDIFSTMVLCDNILSTNATHFSRTHLGLSKVSWVSYHIAFGKTERKWSFSSGNQTYNDSNLYALLLIWMIPLGKCHLGNL